MKVARPASRMAGWAEALRARRARRTRCWRAQGMDVRGGGEADLGPELGAGGGVGAGQAAGGSACCCVGPAFVRWILLRPIQSDFWFRAGWRTW